MAIGCGKDPPLLFDSAADMFTYYQQISQLPISPECAFHRDLPPVPSWPPGVICPLPKNHPLSAQCRAWREEIYAIAAQCGCLKCKRAPYLSYCGIAFPPIRPFPLFTISPPEDAQDPCTHPPSSELHPEAHQSSPSPAVPKGLQLASEHPETSIPTPAPATAPLPAEPIPSAPVTTACGEPPAQSLLCSNPPSSLCLDSPTSLDAGECQVPGRPGSVPVWRQRLSPPPNIHTVDHHRKMGWLHNCRSLEDRCTELEAHYHNWKWQRQSATATRKSGGAIPKSGGAEFAHWYRPPPIYRLTSFHSLMRRNVRLHSIHPLTLL